MGFRVLGLGVSDFRALWLKASKLRVLSLGVW